MIELIERAKARGEATAIRKGESAHTYRDLLHASEHVARSLLAGGEDLREARVGFMIPPGLEYAATQWGIWRAGGTAVPLSASAATPELDYALKDSRASIVVAAAWQDRLQSLAEKSGVRLLTVEDSLGGESGSLPDVAPERRAMILYTSGTTSKPKGVVTTHEQIRAQVVSLVEAWGWRSDDRIPLFLPLHHIHGIINVLTCATWAGAEIDAFESFDATAVLEKVAAGAYTLFMAVPTIYVKLIAAMETASSEDAARYAAGFASMRLMVSGSAALPVSVHERWTALTGQKLLERYGMTEIGMALSNPLHGERRPGAVGEPLPGVEIRLVDETGAVVAEEDRPGEIQVRGPSVFLEYWDRPEATRDSFVDGWFRTGDMAVREAGYYRIMGRLSVDIIKSGGYKLSALEIEETLREHPAIGECAVVGIADDTWGECVAAAVVLEADAALDLRSLQEWARERLSQYKLPRRLLTLPELPRNAMGKVTKPAVREMLERDETSLPDPPRTQGALREPGR